MRKNFILICLLFLVIRLQPVNAQQWHYFNPTLWFDINAVKLLGPGIISTGGGWETHDSIQIMFQSSDWGQSWYENAHDGMESWNKSIAFSDAMNGIGVGNNGRIIRTDDAGGNWGWAVFPIDRTLNKIFYAGAGKYYVVGGNKANDSVRTILKSNNYGFNWNVIYDTLGTCLKSVYFFDTLKGIAVGNQGAILGTSNGGNNWSAIAAPLQRDYNAITFINADTGYIVGGIPYDSCHRTILRSTDGGANWSVLVDAAGGILKDISFADALEGFAVGDSATVLKTTDGGLNWVPIVIDTSLTGNETFNTVEFYNLNFGAIAGKAGLLYLYIDRQVEAYTFGLGQIGTTDATLRGAINTHTKNAKYSFVYSTNTLFTSPNTSPEVNIQNDSLFMITEHITGLSPNTTYYYFLKAATASDTIYGDTLSFYTGFHPPFAFQTYDATGVSNWSAVMNGYIKNIPEPVNLYFEYGTSPDFGSQVPATPASVNDTLDYDIQTTLLGLQYNKQYYFRLKGVTATKTYYGDTKMFHAVNLPWANTGSASNVTSTAAQLNGNAGNPGSYAAVKFEYGLTALYGTEVNAVPDSVFGNNNVNASVSLTGLTPLQTYHFRIKAITAAGTSYGGDMTFITGGPVVSTYGASNINVNSAQINGSVNANGLPTAIKFEWGTSTAYGNTVNAVPDSSSASSNINIYAQLTGLTMNTTYFFRAVAMNSLGTVYGNVASFVTNAPTIAQTLPATEITVNSATLNGFADAGGQPTALKFDYGLTTAYGNEVNAVPDSSSIIGSVNASYPLGSLTPNTTYHFRLKTISNTSTLYGNDMIFFTGASEIPNFDFEFWTPITLMKPDGFSLAVGKITQYAPACHGNYAVKIENDSVPLNGKQPGAILIGNTIDQGHTFIGGTPFNARPDTLIGCFNYSIPNNDTALIKFELKKQGVVISDNWFEVYGNSSGVFKELKFPIPYTASGNADSLIIGFVATDIRHSMQPSISGYFIVDNVRFTGTSANIPNNDFENWDSTLMNSLDNWVYNNMFTPDPIHPQSLPVTRTTDAQHGSYAVLLQNYLYPGDTIRGYLATNLLWNAPGFAVNGRHQSLTGYYKFLPENNDTLGIQIAMYKNHGQMGWGNLFTSSAVTSYAPFVLNIYYNDSTVPDSCRISIQTSTRKPLGNTQLYIDNLNFDGFLSGTKEIALTDAGNFDFNVYPNPFSGKATVSFTTANDEDITVRLFDLSGIQVALLANGRFKPGNYQLDLPAAGLSKGFYICVINTADEVHSKKIIVY